MMNDGNPLKPKIKTWISRVQRKRYGRFVLSEAEDQLRKNPALAVSSLTKEEEEAIQEQWSGLNMKISPLWHQMYKNVLGKFDPKMIPVSVYRLRAEPLLTDYRMERAYGDKNAHHIFIPDANRPQIILQHVHRRYYGLKARPLAKSQVEKYVRQQEGHFFLKPAMDGGGGQFISPFQVEKGVISRKGISCTIEALLAPYPQNFLIQRKVIQHPSVAAIYANSVNTFRVSTLREGHEIRVSSDVMRIGQGGSEIDNMSKGGMVVGMYADGSISSRAMDKNFNWIDEHPDSKVKFADVAPFPFVKKVEDEAVRLHERFPYSDMICWDLTFDENEQVVVIEYNLRGFGVNMQQIFHGPYFGDRTEEWLQKMREVYSHANTQTGFYPALPKL